MKLFRGSNAEPLWKEEFPTQGAQERYVTRRQFTKFLTLTSFGFFVGNLWILVRSWFSRTPSYAMSPVAKADEIPVGGVKLFTYPTPDDPCIMIRTSEDTYVAYSQKCPHLACAVYYAHEHSRIECPCHEGYFAVDNGRVLEGPPPRPLPRIVLERRGNDLIATRVDLQTEA